MKRKSFDAGMLIVSTRVRLARNLAGVPFRTTNPDAFEGVAETVKKRNTGFSSARIDQLPANTAAALHEQHLISKELLGNDTNGIIVTKSDESSGRVCVMLGEEDHIRIQVIRAGLDLGNAYQLAKKIATDIEGEHKIARSESLGYLTSCPTNLGAAMRASVMLFLPALTLSGEIHHAIANLKLQKITVRGVYGEGSQAHGHMYQISNQACLNMREDEILERVSGVVNLLVRAEAETQAKLFGANPDQITNQVMRSFGILTNSYMISSDEATEHLAWCKLGECLGIYKFKPRALDDLFFVIKPATLMSRLSTGEIATRDKMRAKEIAQVLRRSKI